MQIQYSPLNRFIQRLSASAPASWLLAHVLRYVDRLALRLSGGRRTLTSILAGLPVVLVTTTGARTGKLRTSSLVPIRDPSDQRRFALVATNFGQHHFPAWYYNLKKTPRAACALNGLAASYLAREATGEEYRRLAALASETYFGYELYRQRAHRRIPIMVMDREEENR